MCFPPRSLAGADDTSPQARGKLQQQLDTLITKTSEKMSKYGSVHARVKEDFVKDSSAESEGVGSQASRPASPKEVVDKQVKKLIKIDYFWEVFSL